MNSRAPSQARAEAKRVLCTQLTRSITRVLAKEPTRGRPSCRLCFIPSASLRRRTSRSACREEPHHGPQSRPRAVRRQVVGSWNHSITISRTWRRTIRWTILWRAWSCRNLSSSRRSRAGRAAMMRGRLDSKLKPVEFRMAGVWLQTGCARRIRCATHHWEIRLIRLHIQYRMSPCLSDFAALPRPFKIPSSRQNCSEKDVNVQCPIPCSWTRGDSGSSLFLNRCVLSRQRYPSLLKECR
ncbi:hypothetical protein BDZ89DRAFT_466394 [Hymenopellis radicata]|nr:hypothetical protein BDZ89DRAFT_466394 [Hymenopellis radicata]